MAWLGRQGTRAVAISIVLGIFLPPLGAIIRPYFPETVFALLVLAFLRVDPGALREQLAKPRLLVAAAIWTMLIVPLVAGLALSAIDLKATSPALLLALVINFVAPPIFASPALAALMGLNAAITLALLLVCIAVTPFLAPALVAMFAGSAVTFSPLSLGLRLVLMLAGAALTGVAVRAVAGKPWVERQAERIDGLNVIVLFLFAVALMGDVLSNTISQPLYVLGLLALGCLVTFGLYVLTALLLIRVDFHTAVPLAHAAASRNTGLMLAAAAGAVPELVWLYMALLQIPIYALPLVIKPLLRRFTQQPAA
ncbi:Sodium Bile acid symporter family protein [Rhodoplanes sp. Z2-YC6860]|nr:Sodium Bile acid symporter family protein [Rhodoplanes sp. Z2-YC6860]